MPLSRGSPATFTYSEAQYSSDSLGLVLEARLLYIVEVVVHFIVHVLSENIHTLVSSLLFEHDFKFSGFFYFSLLLILVASWVLFEILIRRNIIQLSIILLLEDFVLDFILETKFI